MHLTNTEWGQRSCIMCHVGGRNCRSIWI